jgi:tetratricopeptide (TPR) repeat protein
VLSAVSAEEQVVTVVVGDIPAEPLGYQPRTDLLTELDRAGQRDPVIHVMTGMPGAGKTQVAAGYARAMLAKGWRLVAWINAGNVSSLLAGGAAIADAMSLSEGGTGRAGWDPGQVARHRPEADANRCLIVFDNASDPDVVRPFVPAGTAQVVITSNRQPVTCLGTSVEVGVFTAEEALAFLAERTGLPDASGAAAVAAEVGYLPLALAHAAGVIAAERLSYADYGERLRALLREERLSREGRPYPRGVAEAVLLSLNTVRTGNHADVCIGVMEIMAVLSAAGVRRDLLHSAGRMGVLASGRHRVEADLVNRALEQLTHRSLLTRSMDDQTIRTHCLVTQVVRDEVARRKCMTAVCRAAASALEARARALAGSPDRPAVRDIPEQVVALQDYATPLLDSAAVPAGEAEELARVLLRLRSFALQHLIELSDSAPQAITVGEPLTADLQRLLGPDHPDTLTTRDNLAVAYQDAGRVAEAIALFEQVLAAREQVLGPDHPDTLTTQDNLATAHRDAGRAAEAIRLHEQTLAAFKRVLGPDHPETLGTGDNLALALWAAGRIAEAIFAFDQVLTARERLLGYDHPDTLTTRNNLAAAYWAEGRVADAIPLHERVLAAREWMLGPDHPATLTTQNNLAAAYRDSGRIAEAIALFEQVLAARERVLGPDHPATATTRDNLAAARSKRAKRSKRTRQHRGVGR